MVEGDDVEADDVHRGEKAQGLQWPQHLRNAGHHGIHDLVRLRMAGCVALHGRKGELEADDSRSTCASRIENRAGLQSGQKIASCQVRGGINSDRNF